MRDAGLLDLGGALLSVLLVLGLAYGILSACRRVRADACGGEDLRVLSSFAVGARERLVVVAWRDTALLLGVTAGSITVIERGATPHLTESTEGGVEGASAFRLSRLLKPLRDRLGYAPSAGRPPELREAPPSGSPQTAEPRPTTRLRGLGATTGAASDATITRSSARHSPLAASPG